MDRKKFSSRSSASPPSAAATTTTVALAGVAPIPWLLEGSLDDGDAAPGQRVQAADREGARVARPRYASKLDEARLAPLAAVLLAAGLLAGCGGKKSADHDDRGATENGCTVDQLAAEVGARRSAEADREARSESKTYVVTMKTNCGTFTFKIDQAQSPNASASFVTLVQKGFFDKRSSTGSCPGFMIQGGDPTGTGTGGPGYETVDTPPAGASTRTASSRWRRRRSEPPGTAGSQFFVVTAANAACRPTTRSSGRSTKGLDVVDRIGKLGDAQRSSRRRSSRSSTQPSRARTRDLRRRPRRRRRDPVRVAEAAAAPARTSSTACARLRSTRSSSSRAPTRSRRPRRSTSRARGSSTAPTGRSGPGASLRCGLAALGDDVDAALVVLADGPYLDPRAIERVLAHRDQADVRHRHLRRRAQPSALIARSLWGEHPRRRRPRARGAAHPVRRPDAAGRHRHARPGARPARAVGGWRAEVGRASRGGCRTSARRVATRTKWRSRSSNL